MTCYPSVHVLEALGIPVELWKHHSFYGFHLIITKHIGHSNLSSRGKESRSPARDCFGFFCFLFLCNSQPVGHGDGRHRAISRALEPYMYYALSLPQIKFLALYKF